jgi:hypothetical protein
MVPENQPIPRSIILLIPTDPAVFSQSVTIRFFDIIIPACCMYHVTFYSLQHWASGILQFFQG